MGFCIFCCLLMNTMNNLSASTIIEEHSHGRGTPPHCAGSPPPAHTPSVAATGARARGSAGAMAAAAPGPSVRLRFRGATLALALPEGGCDAAALRAAVEDATGVCGMRPTRRARWHAAGAVLARARRPRCLLVPSTATRASPPDAGAAPLFPGVPAASQKLITKGKALPAEGALTLKVRRARHGAKKERADAAAKTHVAL